MKRRKQFTGKSIKKWYENHPIWVVLSIVFFVLSLAVVAATVFSFTSTYIQEKILWKNIEQSKIDKLAPTQTLAYFNSVLGEPNTKEVRGKIAKYIYRERAYWVEAFADESGIVQAMDVTACGEEGFYPVIKNNPVGGQIVLGKTKMVHTTPKDRSSWSFKTHYFQKQATAPSYYYDEYYSGGASSYQTVFTGHNELCGYLVLPTDILKTLTDLDKSTSLSEDQINRLRQNVNINTFAVTSPKFNTGKNDDLGNYGLNEFGEGGIGVSNIDKAILTPSSDNKFDKDKYKNTKDFEVIKFE